MTENKRVNKLIIQISKNKTKALTKLCDLLYSRMEEEALSVLESESNVEEALGEALLVIYLKSKYFNKQDDGIDWIFDIVKKQSLNYERWKREVDKEC